jgi:hypothetical protein
MSSTITNPPKGLISLFGLNDMGGVPRELSGVVAPSLDMTEFVMLNRESLLPGTVTATATGFRNIIEVPAGQTWVIHGYSVDCYELVAPCTGTLRAAYTESAGCHIGLGPTVSIAAASDRRLAMSNVDKYFVPSGARIGVWVESIAGGGQLAVQAALVITRLRT